MKHLRVIIFTLLLVILVTPLVALASNISNARYWAQILVSNNSTATTNVATTISYSLNTTNLINGNYINAGANNSVMRSSSGADLPFQPGYTPGGYPWCVWVPSIGANTYLTDILYTANSTGGEMRYFPGPAGMTTIDTPPLELGDNFTYEAKGWFDTTVSGDIASKPFAIEIRSDGIGNVTCSIAPPLIENFTTDEWTDVGTGIGVNIGNSRMEWDTTNDAESSYRHLFPQSNTVWSMEFDYRATTVGVNALSGFGFLDSPNGDFGTSGTHDSIHISINNLDVKAKAWDGGGITATAAIGILLNTTYYFTLERTLATNIKLSIYTDAARTVHRAGSPVNVAIPATVVGLDVLEVAGWDTGAQSVGWLDSLDLNPAGDLSGGGSLSVNASGVSPGEHEVEVSANVTHLRLYIDSVLEDSAAMGGISVPDNGNDWVSFTDDCALYAEYQTIDVDGVQQQDVAWEYGATFTDLSGQSHPATPTFRTLSSDPDVSANMTAFTPISEAVAPDYILEDAPAFIDAAGLVGNITAPFTIVPPTTGFPLAGVIAAVAAATSTPAQLPLLLIAVICILAVSLTVSALIRQKGSGSIIIKIIAITAVMGIFIALRNFGIDFWMLCFFLVISIAMAMASKQLGWT